MVKIGFQSMRHSGATRISRAVRMAPEYACVKRLIDRLAAGRGSSCLAALPLAGRADNRDLPLYLRADNRIPEI